MTDDAIFGAPVERPRVEVEEPPGRTPSPATVPAMTDTPAVGSRPEPVTEQTPDGWWLRRTWLAEGTVLHLEVFEPNGNKIGEDFYPPQR